MIINKNNNKNNNKNQIAKLYGHIFNIKKNEFIYFKETMPNSRILFSNEKKLEFFFKSLIIKICKRNNFKKDIFIKWLTLRGLGYKLYYISRRIILDFNQSHWYIIDKNITNSVNIFLLKQTIILCSNDKKQLEKLCTILLNIKKTDYYKGKGLILNSKKKLILKKNERENY